MRERRARGLVALRAVDPDRILQMREDGLNLRRIAENLGVDYGTVREKLKRGERKTPRKTDREKPRLRSLSTWRPAGRKTVVCRSCYPGETHYPPCLVPSCCGSRTYQMAFDRASNIRSAESPAEHEQAASGD